MGLIRTTAAHPLQGLELGVLARRIARTVYEMQEGHLGAASDRRAAVLDLDHIAGRSHRVAVEDVLVFDTAEIDPDIGSALLPDGLAEGVRADDQRGERCAI